MKLFEEKFGGIITVIILVMCIFATGCTNTTDTKSIKSVLITKVYDQSTPDNAMQSYWNRVVETRKANYIKHIEELKDSNWRMLYDEELINRVILDNSKQDSIVNKNSITKVTIESPSRALVFFTDEYKNIYRYTFTSHNNKWYLQKAEEVCIICKGVGTLYYDNNKECDFCKGTGWINDRVLEE